MWVVSVSRLRVALTWLLGGWLLVLLAEAGPHLVHHAFETDEDAECAFLAAADHAPGDVEAPPAIEPPRASDEHAVAATLPLPLPSSPRSTPARSPPRASPALG